MCVQVFIMLCCPVQNKQPQIILKPCGGEDCCVYEMSPYTKRQVYVCGWFTVKDIYLCTVIKKCVCTCACVQEGTMYILKN